jgi:hypothetical protein
LDLNNAVRLMLMVRSLASRSYPAPPRPFPTSFRKVEPSVAELNCCGLSV